MTPRAAIFVIPVALVASGGPPPLGAQTRSLNDVVERMTEYIASYGPQLATLVAEEHYTQWIEAAGSGMPPAAMRRVIESDFVLTRAADGAWVAFRDAFEVDGVPVRDREDRLVRLLSMGSDADWRQAAAIANESARFNVGSDLITRNVNVPTFVVQVLHPEHRRRFRFSRADEPDRDDTRFQIAFRERERPTLVRQQGGADQPLRGTVTVDPVTGAVWETHLTWERGPGGHIDVTYGRVENLDAIVPVRMAEEYRAGAAATIRGEATYRNFRRFTTSTRVITR